MIQFIGFDLDKIGDNVILNRNTFVDNMNKCMNDCKIFKDTVKCEFLFGVKIKKYKMLEDL